MLLSGICCNDEFPKHRQCRWTSECLEDLCLYLKVRMDEKPLRTESCKKLLVSELSLDFYSFIRWFSASALFL
jgi:hypothetical protein